MSDSFRGAVGRKVISRASAQELGTVSHLLVDAQRRRVAAVIIGRGRKAQLVDWSALSGFGPDAVMVGEEGALRPPADERERAAADGKLELVGKRALTERGNELGTVGDVTFDSGTGELETCGWGTGMFPRAHCSEAALMLRCWTTARNLPGSPAVAPGGLGRGEPFTGRPQRRGRGSPTPAGGAAPGCAFRTSGWPRQLRIQR